MSLSLKEHCLNSDVSNLAKVKYSCMVHGILEETNYELKIRGKENLYTVSREVVSNKCDNLLKNTSPNLFEEALVIKEMQYD